MTKRAVVLTSGGLDSATCLAIATAENYDCYCLSFDYGQKNKAELNSADRLADAFNAKQHYIFKLPLNQFGGSALTDEQLQVEEANVTREEIPTTYVPARNTIFIAIALGWAESLGATDIFTGICSTDHAGYPDTRPEYFSAYQHLAALATKQSVTTSAIELHAPLLHLTKAQTIAKGIELGVDYSLTVTCYRPTDTGLACGSCDSCVLRKQGFVEAGVDDPTRYVGG